MELHFFRHGQTDWNEQRRVQGQSESRLTELGIQQARELGQRIQSLRFERIYCSSSLRTRQTAEHAFGLAEVAIDYLDSLREIDLGPWEGQLYDDLAQNEPASYEHFWQQPQLFEVNGAESFFQLRDRALAAIEGIAAQHAGHRIAIVSHGALIKTLLCHLEDKPLSELWLPPAMHNCAHSIVSFQHGDAPKILQYADQAWRQIR
jgi:broad specificity phosphatase PhoE